MFIDDQQLEVLINEVHEYYGYDFSSYSRASFKRRVDRLLQMDGITNFSDFLSNVRLDPQYFKRMVEEITVNVTEMFRDPLFYKFLRTEILPVLATKPFIRIWHAGCSTGEEVFSIAILLHEAGLLHKSLLYATDISPAVLDIAKKGLFPLRMIKLYSENYMASGGKEDFSKYYTANYGSAKFEEALLQKMVFSQHNLVSDRSFNEFDLVLCRNVMIYFDKDTQRKILSRFVPLMKDNALLFAGHSENFLYVSDKLKLRGKTVYELDRRGA